MRSDVHAEFYLEKLKVGGYMGQLRVYGTVILKLILKNSLRGYGPRRRPLAGSNGPGNGLFPDRLSYCQFLKLSVKFFNATEEASEYCLFPVSALRILKDGVL
jgi:hypothetical protein